MNAACRNKLPVAESAAQKSHPDHHQTAETSAHRSIHYAAVCQKSRSPRNAQLNAAVKKNVPHTKGHQRTRSDHATELTQDYVEAIAELQEQKGECRVRDLASRFAVSHVTVSRALARMQRDGFIQTQPYGPVQLTEQGQKLAGFSRHRHHVVMQFLISLGVSHNTAAIDTEGIEHHVSDETLARMEEFVMRNTRARAADS